MLSGTLGIAVILAAAVSLAEQTPASPPSRIPTLPELPPGVGAKGPRIATVALNRRPGYCSTIALGSPAVPPDGFAYMNLQGVVLGVVVSNPSDQPAHGRLAVKMIDPGGGQPFHESRSVALKAKESTTQFFSVATGPRLPLVSAPVRTGAWKGTVTLDNALAPREPPEVRAFELFVEDPSRPSAGTREPAALGRVRKWDPPDLGRRFPDLARYERAMRVLDGIMLLLAARAGSRAGLPKDADAPLWETATDDFLGTADAANRAAMTSATIRIEPGAAVEGRRKVALRWKNEERGVLAKDGPLRVRNCFDRAVLTLSVPSGIELIDQPSGLAETADDSGTGRRVLAIVESFVDKRLVPDEEHLTTLTLDESEFESDDGYTLMAQVQLQFGPFGRPLGEKPLAERPAPLEVPGMAVYDYRRWLDRPDDVYWYVVSAASAEAAVEAADPAGAEIVVNPGRLPELSVPDDEASGAEGMLDIVFCIDTTGSMADDIQAVQQASQQILDRFEDFSARAGISFQVGLVTYQDHTDAETFKGQPEEAWLQAWPLSADSRTVRDNILAIRINRKAVGGDIPEDLFAALMCAMDARPDWEGKPVRMGWRDGAAKIALVMCDAPPHDPDFEGRTLADVARRAEELDPVHVYPLILPGSGPALLDPTVAAMKRLAEATKGETTSVSGASELPEAIVLTVQRAVETHRLEVWRRENPPYALFCAVGAISALAILALAGATYAQLRQRRRQAEPSAARADDRELTGQSMRLPPERPA